MVDVRPEEASSSLLMFFYFFLIQTSAYIIEPVKISLYLRWLRADRLPYAYLLSAILIGFVVTLNLKLLESMKRNLYISSSLAFFISNLILFWFLFKLRWPWLSLVYWFWSDLFMVTSVTQFWILINDIYNPRQAKRLVGFLVSGGLLGGVGGSFLASRLARTIGTENLLLICPLMLVFCLAIVHRLSKLLPKEKKEEVKETVERKRAKARPINTLSLIKKNRYLLILSGIVAAGMIVTTLVDFQFISVVGNTFKEKDLRTSFLGSFLTVLLIFSYFLHILLTNRILRKFGLRVALLIAPVFLLAGSAAAFFVPIVYLIYWAVFIKGADKSLSYSLNQSVRELLYIPVFPEVKYKAKVFIDMFVTKFAKGFGSLFLLLFFSVLHFTIKQISLLVIIFVLVWIILNLLVTKEYVGIVKKNLKIKWEDADKFVAEKIDIDLTKLVFDTLESKKRSSVLYAMNLFDLLKREKLSPELKKIISYKSDEIRARSMDSLLEQEGSVLVPEMDETLEEESLDVEIKEIMTLDVYQELMREYIDKIAKEGTESAEVSKMEAAKVLGMMESSSSLIQNLNKLLKDDSPEVLRYAIESAERLKRREFVPLIIQHLRKPATQEVASKALIAYGTKIIGTLKDYLGDPEEDIRLRKALPDILAQIDTQRAADILTLELKKKNEDVESEIIEAMYKLRSKDPQIPFQEKIILPETLQIIKKCYLILMELNELKTEEKKALLAKSLESNLARSLMHIFELLSLIYPQEDIIKAYQNICVGTKKAIDYSLELLDNILKKEVKEVLLPIIDDLPLEEKVRRCRKLLKSLEKIQLS